MSIEDLKRGYAELLDSQDGYLRAAAYAKGASPEVFSNESLVALLNLDSTDYQLNYSGIPVKLLSERVNYESARVLEDPDATDRITDIWEANEMPLEIQHFHRDAFMYGDNYTLVWLDDNDEVDICPVSPLETRMIYADKDQRKKEYAIRAWEDFDELGQEVIRANLYYFDRIEKYVAVKKQEQAKMIWEVFEVEGEDFPLFHDFGEIPIFHARPAGRPYGTPEHIDAYGAQDAIVKFTVSLMETVDFMAFPQRVILRNTKANGSVEGGLSKLGGKPETGTRNTGSTLKASPRTILELDGDSFGQFDPADAKAFTESVDHFVKGMADVCRIDMRHFSSVGGQHPSADALRAADAPLRSRIAARQKALGAFWSDVLTFVLKLDGIEIDSKIEVHWAPQEIDNLKELTDMVIALIKEGQMPVRAAYRYLGITDEEMDAMGIPKLVPLVEEATAPVETSDLSVQEDDLVLED